MKYIKNNAWVTVITIFGFSRIASRVSPLVKIIAESLHGWQKIVIPGYECVILFLTRYFMSWTHNSTKNNYRPLISPLLLRTVFPHVALWPHNSWSMTLRERGVLALWRHISRLFLHTKLAQSRSSLVNKNREYRFLTTRYAWLVRTCKNKLLTIILSFKFIFILTIMKRMHHMNHHPPPPPTPPRGSSKLSLSLNDMLVYTINYVYMLKFLLNFKVGVLKIRPSNTTWPPPLRRRYCLPSGCYFMNKMRPIDSRITSISLSLRI